MKLKKSFSVSLLLLIIFSFFSSCKSIDNSNIQNIYIEYLNIGDTYFKLEDYKNASKYYNLALQNKDIYWATYYKLANCYAFMSDWNNSLIMYKKLLKRDEENNTLKANIAYIYAMKGDYHYASIIYEDLINKQENNKDYIENYLAIILADTKHFNEKKETFYELFSQLQEKYPDSNNISILKNKYDEIIAANQPETEQNEDENKEDVSLEDLLNVDDSEEVILTTEDENTSDTENKSE